MRMYEKILISAVVVGYWGMVAALYFGFHLAGLIIALLWMIPVGYAVAFMGVELLADAADKIVERDQNIKRIADSADAALIERRRGKTGGG